MWVDNENKEQRPVVEALYANFKALISKLFPNAEVAWLYRKNCLSMNENFIRLLCTAPMPRGWICRQTASMYQSICAIQASKTLPIR